MSQANLKNAHKTVALRISQICIKFNINGRLQQFSIASSFNNSQGRTQAGCVWGLTRPLELDILQKFYYKASV